MRHVARSMSVVCIGLGSALASSGAHADIVFLTQSRTITAATTANADTLTSSAANFAPFVDDLQSTALFSGPLGVPRVNRARTTITSILDSNSIRTNTRFECEGGENDNGGEELGDASLDILLTFTISESTEFNFFSSPRPNGMTTDEFEIEFKQIGGDDIYANHGDPNPQLVDITGILQPGDYQLKVKVEFSANAPDQAAEYDFYLNVPAPVSTLPFAAGAIFAARRRRR